MFAPSVHTDPSEHRNTRGAMESPEGPCSFFALQSVRLAAGEERGSLVRSLTPRCLRTRVLTCLDPHNLSHLGFLDLQSVATSRSMSPWAPSGSPPLRRKHGPRLDRGPQGVPRLPTAATGDGREGGHVRGAAVGSGGLFWGRNPAEERSLLQLLVGKKRALCGLNRGLLDE